MKSLILIFVSCFIAFNVSAQTPENWTQFRGPNGQGVSKATELPVQWSSTENIAWKIDIPGVSWSSPIVWNDHIFVTTTTENDKNCHVIAVDRQTGRILWDKMVFTQNAPQRHDMNSFATPTPVTDGNTVYAVFAGGGIAALDFNGNVRWIKDDLNFYSQHGKGTSPILYNDMLILAVNHSNREEPRRLGWQVPWDQSFLLAIDKSTGRERWRGMRGMTRIAHSTPVIMQVNGRDQIISAVGDAIQGFDPSDGRLIWTATVTGEPCVPTPAVGDGLVYHAAVGGQPIRAIRTNGQGDVTETHMAWSEGNFAPGMSSFLYVSPYLYACTNRNSFACLNATTGEVIWQLPLNIGALNPSPLFADGKIYILSEDGITAVLRPSNVPGQPAEIISTNSLEGDMTRASIAIAGKQLIIRSGSKLWCIGR